MAFIKENCIILVISLIIGTLFVIYLYLEKKKDLTTDYNKENIYFEFWEMQNGETWLTIRYDNFTQKRKKEYILSTWKPGMEIENKYGHKYIIFKLVSEKYYDEKYFENGNKTKTGPYIVYSIKPKAEIDTNSININNSQGIQISISGNATQVMDKNYFGNIEELINYKQILIDKSVSEDDINILFKNPTSENKKVFLEKYGTIISGISALTGFLNFLKK